MLVDEDGLTEFRVFVVRARSQDVSGDWSYQLTDKASGEDYQGDEYFAEAVLDDA